MTLLGECRSKCYHLRRTPLRPETSQQLNRVYLAKGVQATAAIEGNTLTQEQVEQAIEGTLEVAPSRDYQKREIENILAIWRELARRVLEDDDAALSVERIGWMHRRLFQGIDTDDHNPLGEIPTVDIGVGRYRGAPREDCAFLLEQLVQWIAQEWSRTRQGGDRWIDSLCAAIIKAIVAHLYFVWIHPFGDGNGRTARLIESLILLRAGVPLPATQLLSNHYNLTRDRYYRELRRSSESGGDIVPFLMYAVEGLRDGLEEQIAFITEQQHRIFWTDYIYRSFRDQEGKVARRQRNLALELAQRDGPVDRADVRRLSPQQVEDYFELDEKTVQRDLDALERGRLIRRLDGGRIVANRDLLLPFMPPSVPEDR
ncbi:MAG: Fic family protein [Phycisphaerales bacterium JB039]